MVKKQYAVYDPETQIPKVVDTWAEVEQLKSQIVQKALAQTPLLATEVTISTLGYETIRVLDMRTGEPETIAVDTTPRVDGNTMTVLEIEEQRQIAIKQAQSEIDAELAFEKAIIDDYFDRHLAIVQRVEANLLALTTSTSGQV
jgi:hypothetical protein